MPDSTLSANGPTAGSGFGSRAYCSGEALAPSRRSLALWIWSMLLIADSVLIARRASGELVAALPTALAVLSTAFVATGSFAAWMAFRTSSQRQTSRDGIEWLPAVISGLVPLAWGGAISARASPLTVGLLVGVILFYVLAALSFAKVRQSSAFRSDKLPACRSNRMAAPIAQIAVPELPLVALDDSNLDEAAFEPADITQWLSRRTTDENELIEGWLRVDFAGGQREVAVHISFCPPLSGYPEVETEDLDGAELEIRIAATFPFGARLAVRRTNSVVEPLASRIGFIAVAAVVRRAA